MREIRGTVGEARVTWVVCGCMSREGENVFLVRREVAGWSSDCLIRRKVGGNVLVENEEAMYCTLCHLLRITTFFHCS